MSSRASRSFILERKIGIHTGDKSNHQIEESSLKLFLFPAASHSQCFFVAPDNIRLHARGSNATVSSSSERACSVRVVWWSGGLVVLWPSGLVVWWQELVKSYV